MFLNGGSGKDVLKGGADDDTLYGNGGDDSLSGLGGDDVLAGNSGNDTVAGGAGDDYIMGGLGNDRLDGGAGQDWAGYEDATAGVKVDLSVATAQNTGGAGTDTLISIEYVYGSAYADTLTGNQAFNYIFGGAGNDQLRGGQGDDFLAGGAGNDLIDGGQGSDTVSFDDGQAGGVAVYLLGHVAYGHGDDTLVSIENIYGSSHDDELFGNSAGNYIYGGDGDDRIGADGGGYTGGDLPTVTGEQDVLDGGAGNDTFVPGQSLDVVILGGDGVDTLNYSFGGDGPQLYGVTVDLNQTGPQLVHSGHYVTLSSIEQVIGTSQSDFFVANSSTNLFVGLGGTDFFIFRSLADLGNGDTADVVSGNFQPGQGAYIDLHSIDANANLAGVQAFTAVGTAFTGHAGEMILNLVVEKSMYLAQFDVNGDAVADAALWIQGQPTAGNFLFA